MKITPRMSVSTEHMSDEELFGQRNAPTALRAGFEEIEPEFGESELLKGW